MSQSPKLTRTPQGEYVLDQSIMRIGLELGPTGIPQKLKMEMQTGSVLWATVSEKAIDKFARDYVEARKGARSNKPS